MQAEISDQIKQGLSLESEGDGQNVIDYFVALAKRYPDHAEVMFETGGAFDSAGHSAEAIPYYYRAIRLGLSDDLLLRVWVQLGSSLRNAGRHEESVQMLAAAYARFPEHRALRAFYALALYSSGKPGQALAQMIELTLHVPNFYERYTRSLGGYASELRDSGR